MKSASIATVADPSVIDLRLDDKGLIEVPRRFRRAHKLMKDSRMLAIEIGDALVLVPTDIAVEHHARRLQGALARQGITTAQLLRNLGKVRRRRLQRRHGKA